MKTVKVPELAESITEGTIVKWLVQEGETVQKDSPIVELETDKVNVEINSEYTGVLDKILAETGQDVSVGESIALIREAGEETQPVAVQQKIDTELSKSEKPAQFTDNIRATPAARKRAREQGIDLTAIDQSFIEAYGTIGVREIELLQATTQQQAVEKVGSSEFVDQNAKPPERPVERLKMSRRRMTIAKHLVEAQQQAAMLTTFNEIDMTNVMELRNERKAKFLEKHGVKLGFMSFFTKAVVGALKDFPFLNAEIDDDELLVKKFYDIGIAVSAAEGLVVPVVRDADQLDFAGIERSILDVSQKARDNTLELADLQGGTFTITNGGVFGSLLSTPILNAPQVGILGMHNIQKRPIVMPDDSIEVRPMMYVAVSYDHRIVDGKEAVQFLVRIKQLLEDPYDLLLEG